MGDKPPPKPPDKNCSNNESIHHGDLNSSTANNSSSLLPHFFSSKICQVSDYIKSPVNKRGNMSDENKKKKKKKRCKGKCSSSRKNLDVSSICSSSSQLVSSELYSSSSSVVSVSSSKKFRSNIKENLDLTITSVNIPLVSNTQDSMDTSFPLGQTSRNLCASVNDTENTPPIFDQLQSSLEMPSTQFTNSSNQLSFNTSSSNVRTTYSALDKGPFTIHLQMIDSADLGLDVSINPITVGRFLQKNNMKGIISGSLKRIGRNRMSMLFDTFENANLCLSNETLISHKYKFFIPSFCISKLGVVRGVPVDISEEEVVSEVVVPQNCGPVIKARRLKYKTLLNGSVTWKPSQTLVLTFDGQILPEKVFLCYNCLPVEAYKYPTVQCHNCCRFGHTKNVCRSVPRCLKCAGSHVSDTCTILEINSKCVSCSGPHFASNPSCPEFIRQKNIKITMSEKSLSYAEASKLYAPVTKSFADTIRSTNVPKTSSNSNPSKSSYKKTVFLVPRSPSISGVGYDRKAHSDLTRDYSSPPVSKNGCGYSSETSLKDQSLKDLVQTLIKLLSSTLISSNYSPSNEASTADFTCSKLTNDGKDTNECYSVEH